MEKQIQLVNAVIRAWDAQPDSSISLRIELQSLARNALTFIWSRNQNHYSHEFLGSEIDEIVSIQHMADDITAWVIDELAKADSKNSNGENV